MDKCSKFVVTLAVLICATNARSWHGVYAQHQAYHKHHECQHSQHWDFPKNGNGNYPWKYYGDYEADSSWEKNTPDNGWMRPDNDHGFGYHGLTHHYPQKWNEDFWVFPNTDTRYATPSTLSRTTPTPITTSASTSSILNVLLCMRSCPITSEYNPVCGTDNVTYGNLGKLECAKNCGVDVALQRSSSCALLPNVTPNPSNTNDNTVATTPTTSTSTSSMLNMLLCMRSCPVTPEYNPVCGTDNVTYSNLGRLECAKNCGVDVAFRRSSSCALPPNVTPNPSNTNNNPVVAMPTTSSSSDVDNNSTTSSLIDTEIKPTRYTMIDLSLLSTTDSVLENSQVVQTNSNSVTISKDILASIFSDLPSTDVPSELSFDLRLKEKESSTTTAVN